MMSIDRLIASKGHPFPPKGSRGRARRNKPGKVYPNTVAMSMAPERLRRKQARVRWEVV